MGVDPKPEDSVRGLHRDSAIMQPHTNRPEATDFLEIQRGVLRVGLQQFKCFIGLFTDGNGKSVVVGPKFWRGVMGQSFVDCPER